MLWCPKVRHVWDIVGLGIFCDVCSGGSRWINFSCSGGPWCWDDVPEMNIILIIDNYVTIFHISLRLSPIYNITYHIAACHFFFGMLKDLPVSFFWNWQNVIVSLKRDRSVTGADVWILVINIYFNFFLGGGNFKIERPKRKPK